MAIDVFHWSARETAARIASGEVSCTEVLEAYLDRIARFNPELNAIVAPDFQRARERAAAADAALAAGENWGPLHGVPVTLKESFDVAGLPTTWGDPGLRNNVPAKNSAVAQTLLDAGAVIMGKTNIPWMISDWQTFNDVYGETKNPWDLARSPGGSSGGAAAAVAAGLSAFDVGSDIGSSIRNPSHYCGIYGHKPSFGIVPQAGHAPRADEPPVDINVLGPLARSPEDLEFALDILARPEGEDATGWRLELPAPRKTRLSDFKVAVMLDSPVAATDSSIVSALERCAGQLADAGVTVDFKARPDIDFARAHKLFMSMLRSAMAAADDDELHEAHVKAAEALADDDDSYGAMMTRAAAWSHQKWFHAHKERNLIRERWAEFFRDYDLMLTPVAATAAYIRDIETPRQVRKIVVNGKEEFFRDQFFWAGPASLSYLPATVAPAGQTESGLPVGVQIIGPYLRDRETIDFARLMRDLIGGATPPPGYRD